MISINEGLLNNVAYNSVGDYSKQKELSNFNMDHSETAVFMRTLLHLVYISL